MTTRTITITDADIAALPAIRMTTAGSLGSPVPAAGSGGGGGGGGGAGLIKGPPASLGPNVSPPATP